MLLSVYVLLYRDEGMVSFSLLMNLVHVTVNHPITWASNEDYMWPFHATFHRYDPLLCTSENPQKSMQPLPEGKLKKVAAKRLQEIRSTEM